jgi:hypothetical protein
VRAYDDSGAVLSTTQVGTVRFDEAPGVSQGPSGNVFIGGDTDGTFPGEVHQHGGCKGLCKSDPFVARLSPL